MVYYSWIQSLAHQTSSKESYESRHQLEGGGFLGATVVSAMPKVLDGMVRPVSQTNSRQQISVWWPGACTALTIMFYCIHSVANAFTSSIVFLSPLKIHSDLPASMDAGRVTALALLDLSAAFDTIDHTILLSRLDDWFGVTGKALGWFKSYLTVTCQKIKLGDCLSSKADLKFGAPQGSVLGPLLFKLYTTPLSTMICEHAIPHYLYANDSQLYVSFASGALQQHWMVYNHVWPLSSHGCRPINWNWTQIKLNSSLLGTNDSEANTSLCFQLSFLVSKLTLLNLLVILV